MACTLLKRSVTLLSNPEPVQPADCTTMPDPLPLALEGSSYVLILEPSLVRQIVSLLRCKRLMERTLQRCGTRCSTRSEPECSPEEERSADNEIGHADETIGFFVINSGVITGTVSSGSLLGDVNLDGVVDFLDIAHFITALTTADFPNEADINQDGSVNFLDIGPLIGLLSGA